MGLEESKRDVSDAHFYSININTNSDNNNSDRINLPITGSDGIREYRQGPSNEKEAEQTSEVFLSVMNQLQEEKHYDVERELKSDEPVNQPDDLNNVPAEKHYKIERKHIRELKSDEPVNEPVNQPDDLNNVPAEKHYKIEREHIREPKSDEIVEFVNELDDVNNSNPVPEPEERDNNIQILGLKSDATDQEINRRYKKLSLAFHPDKLKRKDGETDENFKKRQEVATDKFQKILNAKEFLLP